MLERRSVPEETFYPFPCWSDGIEHSAMELKLRDTTERVSGRHASVDEQDVQQDGIIINARFIPHLCSLVTIRYRRIDFKTKALPIICMVYIIFQMNSYQDLTFFPISTMHTL